MALMTQAPAEIVEQERRLRRDLGFPGLTAIGFSNIVGSGWLFRRDVRPRRSPARRRCCPGSAPVCCARLIALVMIETGRDPAGGRRHRALAAVRQRAGWSAR